MSFNYSDNDKTSITRIHEDNTMSFSMNGSLMYGSQIRNYGKHITIHISMINYRKQALSRRSKFGITVMTLSFRTDRSGQTVQTQIRLLLEEQSDQGLHCLLYHLYLFDEIR